MPQKPAGAVHEMPLLVQQMSGESKPFLNDLQRQALDAALAAKLSKLSTSSELYLPLQMQPQKLASYLLTALHQCMGLRCPVSTML